MFFALDVAYMTPQFAASTLLIEYVRRGGGGDQNLNSNFRIFEN